ncbi:hypothetical protein G9A89_012563 [Geosiphon pyriformis]|nr:hypothetical protein G9A89_012563 [Geosiphon pyriformis]
MKFNLAKITQVFVLVIYVNFVVSAPIPHPESSNIDSLEKRDNFNYGQGTYFQPSLGACGSWVGSNAKIVALAAPYFDPHSHGGSPNQNSLCGKKVRIWRGEKSTEAIVQDRCPECAYSDIDMSPEVFKEIASSSEGRIPIKWSMV